jgi:hypothetical protein
MSATPAVVRRNQRIGSALDRAAAWLRVDAQSVLRFERAGGAQATGPEFSALQAGSLETGVARWRGVISLRRALAVVRRCVLGAAVLALLIDLVIWASGGDRRSWWLLVPLALAVVLAATELRTGVTTQETARLLDSGLGLHSRVATAVELRSKPPAPGSAAALLAARVDAEAGAEVARSFKTARLRGLTPPGEWAALVAALAALALLVALQPSVSPILATPGGQGSLAGGGHGSRGDHRGPGTSSGTKSAAGRAGLPASTTPLLTTTPSHGTFTNPYGPKLTAAELRYELDANNRQQGTHDFKLLHSTAAGAGAGQFGRAGATTQKQGGLGNSQSIGSHLGAGAGGLQSKASQAPPGAGTQPSQVGGHGGATGSGGKRTGPGSPSAHAGSGGSAQGASGHAPPGGEQAGSSPGSSALGAGLTPDLLHGAVGLPIQAGYAPSTDKHGTTAHGGTQTPNGNDVGGRTAVSNSSGSGSGSSLTVIPPSSNSAPLSEQTQRNNYFGVDNQLQLKSW